MSQPNREAELLERVAALEQQVAIIDGQLGKTLAVLSTVCRTQATLAETLEKLVQDALGN